MSIAGAIAAMQAAMHPRHGLENAKQQREDFRQHLLKDSEEAAHKVLVEAKRELTSVLEEVVQQGHDFWSNQVHRVEEHWRERVVALETERATLSAKIEESVAMYEQVLGSLNKQLAEAHSRAEAAQRKQESAVAGLQTQLDHSEATLEESSKTYKELLKDLNKQLQAAQRALQDSQQEKAELSEALATQQGAMEALTRQLSVTREQLSASEARDKKLTALSRHLLARQQQASQQQASPHAAGAADVAPGTHTAGGGAAALAAPAALSSDRHAPLQTGSLLAAEPGEVPGLPAVRPALAAAADAGSRGDNCTLSEPQSSPTKQLAELLLGDAAPAARGTEIDFGPGSDGEGGRSAAAGGPAENAAPCAVSGGSAAAPAAAVVAAVGSSFEPLATAAAIPAATTGSRDEHAEAESD
uniref:Uncharacterized protein n=1 Tax=Chlamydomonas euryale TaxID=1486919 RepID=A0A7R9V427_9CHLO|mmetsp:Transcript_18479/g.55166  ORF Transcript_18479/g.55166 Transcript_18479/m.55166 type:complete len:415 (+) Transcript_18479:336-1580(+)